MTDTTLPQTDAGGKMTALELMQSRYTLGLTQTQLAERHAVSQVMISRYETGKDPVPEGVAKDIRAMLAKWEVKTDAAFNAWKITGVAE